MARTLNRGSHIGLLWGVVGLIVVASCGSPGRRAGPGSGPPALTGGAQEAVALSVDQTESPIIRLKAAVDSLAIKGRPEYRIGPGDVLEIALYARSLAGQAKPELVPVRQDGKIYHSILGEMQAGGLTAPELQRTIADNATPYVKNPFVLVKIAEYNSQRATIIGEIGGTSGTGGRAVTVPLKGPTRLIELMASVITTSGTSPGGGAAASPTFNADLSNIIVTRRSGERFRVNLNTFLFGFDPTSNIEIQDGDLLFIPHVEDNRVFIIGEVRNPGLLPIGRGLTVAEAVSRAGGFTTIARENDVALVRGSVERPEVITIPVRSIVRKGARDQDIHLRNGDILYVPRSPLGTTNLVLSQVLPPLQTYLFLQTLVKK